MVVTSMPIDGFDTKKIDEAVLALLYLTLHDGDRAWKGFDWDTFNRLHEAGFISNPVGKTKSVRLTEKGLRESERLFREVFSKDLVCLCGTSDPADKALLTRF